MTNVNLLPGDKTLEELMDMAGEGYVFDINKNWSIDDKRLNFHLGLKQHGKSRMVRRAGFTKTHLTGYNAGVLEQSSGSSWSSGVACLGLPNCGKGEPGQVMRVAHGTAPALFKNIKVGGNE